jgi:hypothetical protein
MTIITALKFDVAYWNRIIKQRRHGRLLRQRFGSHMWFLTSLRENVKLLWILLASWAPPEHLESPRPRIGVAAPWSLPPALFFVSWVCLCWPLKRVTNKMKQNRRRSNTIYECKKGSKLYGYEIWGSHVSEDVGGGHLGCDLWRHADL